MGPYENRYLPSRNVGNMGGCPIEMWGGPDRQVTPGHPEKQNYCCNENFCTGGHYGTQWQHLVKETWLNLCLLFRTSAREKGQVQRGRTLLTSGCKELLIHQRLSYLLLPDVVLWVLQAPVSAPCARQRALPSMFYPFSYLRNAKETALGIVLSGW